MSTITKTESAQASYEFTTLTCIPGVIEHKGSNIQLLDLPGIIEGNCYNCYLMNYKRHFLLFIFNNGHYTFLNILGASQGKGRGRQVIAVARTADLILMVLDATKKEIHKSLLEAELNAVGIRLNCQKPSIYYKQIETKHNT